MPKILVIVPFALDEQGLARRRGQLDAVRLDPASEFHFRPVTAGPTSFMSPHDWTLMDLAIFEAGAEAQAEGYDGVCIDTMSDSGSPRCARCSTSQWCRRAGLRCCSL